MADQFAHHVPILGRKVFLPPSVTRPIFHLLRCRHISFPTRKKYHVHYGHFYAARHECRKELRRATQTSTGAPGGGASNHLLG